MRAPDAPGRDERDAIDRAWGHAQLASRAERRQNGVHSLRRADDRIGRAGVDAQRAADTGGFVDAGDLQRAGFTACAIERNDRAAGDGRELCDHGVRTGRAAIDRLAFEDRLGVRTTAIVAAAPALCLRKDVVDTVDDRWCGIQTHAASLMLIRPGLSAHAIVVGNAKEIAGRLGAVDIHEAVRRLAGARIGRLRVHDDVELR